MYQLAGHDMWAFVATHRAAARLMDRPDPVRIMVHQKLKAVFLWQMPHVGPAVSTVTLAAIRESKS